MSPQRRLAVVAEGASVTRVEAIADKRAAKYIGQSSQTNARKEMVYMRLYLVV